MNKFLSIVEKGIDWLSAPTTISWLQDGDDTMSRFTFGSLVFITVFMIVIVSVPCLRKKFF